MERLEKIGKVVGVLTAILAVVGYFETISGVGLVWKLVVTAIGGIILTFVSVPYLSKWATIVTPSVLGGPSVKKLSRIRFLAACLSLAIICTFFVVLARALTERSALEFRETAANGRSEVLFVAPDKPISSITIQLPSPSSSTCRWTNMRRDSIPRLDIQMVDSDTQIPKLHIDNFVYPQRIMVSCVPPTAIRAVQTVPTYTEIFLGEQLRQVRKGALALGVVIWLIACYRLWQY